MIYGVDFGKSRRRETGDIGRYATDVSFVESELPCWWAGAIQRIGLLLDLPPGWDGHGAEPVDPQKAYYAVEVLQGLARPGIPRPSIVPTVLGHLQFEWHINEIDLEIEVKSQVNISVYYEDLRSGEEREYELDYDLYPISDAIKKIIDRERERQAA